MEAPLVSTVWLRQELVHGLKNIRLIDGSWHMKSTGRNALSEYKSKRINGAVFIDIDELSDQGSSLPHMMPSDKQFSNHIGQLGISNHSHVIIYDNDDKVGMFSAARLWWMFKAFGHKDVSILDGGLPKWLSDGGPVVTDGPPPDTNGHIQYTIKDKLDIVRYMNDVKVALEKGDIQVVDARSEERFNGSVPEPRAGLCSGHMMGSYNLPYTRLFNKDTKTLASKSVIENEFTQAGVDLDKPIIATCGSGVTACWISFAAALLGKTVPVYDGSWTEYAQYGPKERLQLGTSK